MPEQTAEDNDLEYGQLRVWTGQQTAWRSTIYFRQENKHRVIIENLEETQQRLWGEQKWK